MKRLLMTFALMISAFAVVSAQDYEETLSERKAMTKFAKSELNERASKAARKEAKVYSKQGWIVAPGQLPMEKQLDRAYRFYYEFDESGYPKYVISSAMSVGENYDAAKIQALELAKLSLAGQLQAEIVALVENAVSNSQLPKEQASSMTETVLASTNVISQSLGRVIPLVECYRELRKKNKEVRVVIAYNTATAMEVVKAAVKADLEKKGDKLREKLDKMLAF